MDYSRVEGCSFLYIWFLTLESIYTRKVGGLAEVPPRIARGLVERGYNAWVLTPGHSIECRESSRTLYRTLLGNEEYFIEECLFKTPHLLIRGGLLDEPIVYPRGKLVEKSLVFGSVVSSYYRFLAISSKQPSIVHGNDWHSVPGMIGINASSIEYSLNTSLFYQIHLLSSTIIDIDSFEKYLDIRKNTWVSGFKGVLSFREYYDLSKGFVDKLGAYLSNRVLTVSKGFVRDILRSIGLDHYSRVDYVYNALTWNWNDVVESVRKIFNINPGKANSRDCVRKQFLTNYLSRIKFSIGDPYLERFVKNLAEKYSIKYNEPFSNDGPLVFLSGRASRQKGFDLLIKAMDKIVSEIPSIRIVFTVIPVYGGEDLLEKLVESTVLYREHIRVIPGYVDLDYYRSLYYASTLYLAPSRYEPFGLTVIEALASGTPVLASRTGGLEDIVIDIRKDSVKGTGLLFEPGSLEDLVNSLKYFFDIIINQSETGLINRLRNNCVERSRFFNWDNTVEKLIELYGKTRGV